MFGIVLKKNNDRDCFVDHVHGPHRLHQSRKLRKQTMLFGFYIQARYHNQDPFSDAIPRKSILANAGHRQGE